MNYKIKASSRNRQTIKTGIIILLMTLYLKDGYKNAYYIVIYGLLIMSFVKKLLHKNEIIEISNSQLTFVKPYDEDIVVQLSYVNRISFKTEGNWAIRKDTLELDMSDNTVELIVSSFDIDKLKSVLKDVCSNCHILNDIS